MTIKSRLNSERKVSAKKRAKEEILDRLSYAIESFLENLPYGDDLSETEQQRIAEEMQEQIERVYKFLGYEIS